jgi:transcriptional regulator GlxA family with amidase domain
MNEHGVKFSDVLQQERVKLAKGYLKQDELSLDDVAYLLGYAEQSSFGRAFRRWTGSTPQKYRGGQQAGPAGQQAQALAQNDYGRLKSSALLAETAQAV